MISSYVDRTLQSVKHALNFHKNYYNRQLIPEFVFIFYLEGLS